MFQKDMDRILFPGSAAGSPPSGIPMDNAKYIDWIPDRRKNPFRTGIDPFRRSIK
jgi:hypothetical protein